SDSLIMAFQFLNGSCLGGRVLVDVSGELPHLPVQLGDLSDLPLLLGQHPGLQVDHALGIGKGLFGAVGAIGLTVNAGGEPPPDQGGAEQHQAERSEVGHAAISPPQAQNIASSSASGRRSITRPSSYTSSRRARSCSRWP